VGKVATEMNQTSQNQNQSTVPNNEFHHGYEVAATCIRTDGRMKIKQKAFKFYFIPDAVKIEKLEFGHKHFIDL
jgi:hypothetical protein